MAMGTVLHRVRKAPAGLGTAARGAAQARPRSLRAAHNRQSSGGGTAAIRPQGQDAGTGVAVTLLHRRHSECGSSRTETHWLFPSQRASTSSTAGARPGEEAVSDEVQKEELTSLGFQNKNSNLGSEKIKKGKIKSESVDRKIWLTNPPNLHTILYEKEKHPNSSQRSPNVCNQRFMKIFQLKSL